MTPTPVKRFIRVAALCAVAIALCLPAAANAATPLPPIEGSVVGGFDFAKGLAIVPAEDGSAAALWASDAHRNRVHRIAPDGSDSDLTILPLITGAASLYRPEGVAYDPATGELLVADNENNRIVRYSSAGVPLGQFPGALGYCPSACAASAANGAFDSPTDVEVSGGDVFVADNGNSRLQRFTGSPLAWAQSYAVAGGARAVAVDDADDEAFVSTEDSVVVLSLTGGPSREIGTGELEDPFGLALDQTRGILYVADYDGGAVIAFDTLTGETVDTIPGLDDPADVAVDPVNQILYVTEGEDQIARFNVAKKPECETPDTVDAVAGLSLAVALTCEAGDDTLTYEIVEPPLHGTITDFDPATGDFTYTPEPGYDGTDTIGFTATGPGGTSPLTTLEFKVTAPPPLVAAAAAVPVIHETANLHKVTGTVLVRVPGSTAFVPLSADLLVPLGTLVDTTKGRATLTFADEQKNFYEATFWAGAFQIGQTIGNAPFHEIKLRSEFLPFGVCRKAKKKAKRKKGKGKKAAVAASTPVATISAKKKKKGKKKGKVWGDGKGKFRTSGSGGSATVRGTRWAVTDYENGTLFQVSRGEVTVRDNAAHATITLKAGQSHFAWLSPKSKNRKTSCKV